MLDIFFRQKLINLTRDYFSAENFQELESPVFVDHPPYESTLTAFKTKNFYLATSPEIFLKKSLKDKSLFSISHSFRDLEDNNQWHLPEFLMLEWYELNKNYLDTQDRLTDYLKFIYKNLNLNFPEISHKNIDIDPTLSEPDFNQKFLNEIEPNIPKDKLVFLTGYPTHLSYFAKPVRNGDFLSVERGSHIHSEKNYHEDGQICERFEAYLGGIEIANGNTEDTEKPFIIPPCSGCGLGLDRLALILNPQD